MNGQREITIYSDSRKLLNEATAAAVCSGTATLEAALLDVPQVVVYRTSPENYFLARRLVKLDNIALVNVTAGERIVPELIQHGLSSEKLTDELESMLYDDARREGVTKAYLEVRNRLGSRGAAKKVTRIALKML